MKLGTKTVIPAFPNRPPEEKASLHLYAFPEGPFEALTKNRITLIVQKGGVGRRDTERQGKSEGPHRPRDPFSHDTEGDSAFPQAFSTELVF